MHSGREPGCTVALAPLSPAAGAARSRPPRLPATCHPRAFRVGRGRRRRCSASRARCRASLPASAAVLLGSAGAGLRGHPLPWVRASCWPALPEPGAGAVRDTGGPSPLPVLEGQGASAKQFLGRVGAEPQPRGLPGPPRGAGTPSPQEVGGEATVLPRSSGGQTGRCRVMFLTAKLKTKLQGGCRAVKLGGVVPHRLPGGGAGGGWQIPSVPCPRLRAPAVLPGTVPSIPLFRMVSPSAPVFRFFPGSFHLTATHL